ncbi:MAG: OmpA family protein, partial [Bacteroidota bacterium]
MKNLLLLASFLFVLHLQTYSQTQFAKDALTLRATTINYQFPEFTSSLDREDFSAALEIEYARRLGKNFALAFPLKIGKMKIPTDEMGGSMDVGFSSLDALLQLKFFDKSQFINPYIFAGVGGVWEDFVEFGGQAPVGLGIDFRLSENFYLSTKGEYRFGFDDLRNNVQAGVGLKFLFGGSEPQAPPAPADSDGDGIADNIDQCPNEAGPASTGGCPDRDGDNVADKVDSCPDVAGLAALRGCPDTDSDGIIDQEDECPNEKGPKSNNGCPYKDSDNDGVLDDDDECPNEAGPASLGGCPDSDNDGVANKNDECPNTRGAIATKGCPDTDRDGIADKDDKCPERPGPITNQGCPEIAEEDKKALEFATRAVQFQTGSSRLIDNSFYILDQVVDILRRYPDYNLNINGYTDSVGSSITNQRLSESRAKTCYDYIISKGVDPGRMKYAGYGEADP